MLILQTLIPCFFIQERCSRQVGCHFSRRGIIKVVISKKEIKTSHVNVTVTDYMIIYIIFDHVSGVTTNVIYNVTTPRCKQNTFILRRLDCHSIFIMISLYSI